jgi:hypothetical protein
MLDDKYLDRRNSSLDQVEQGHNDRVNCQGFCPMALISKAIQKIIIMIKFHPSFAPIST